MNKGLVSGLVLLALGLVCGILLATVNHFTAPVIEAQEKAMKYESLNEMLTDFDTRQTDDFDITETTLSGHVDTSYWLYDKTTNDLDYVVYSVSAAGYQSDIVMLIAVDADMIVKGYTIVSEGETAGVVDYIYTIDYKMVGRRADNVVSFDDISSVTTAHFSLTAVLNCFQYVGEQADIDLGGESS